jgi:predicted dehydrogenase
MSLLRIGMIGGGWPALQHGAALRHVPGATLTAMCDIDADRRARYVAEFDPPRVHASYEELVADPEIDAVVISLPNFLHFPATMAALAAGKHVLCEKPPTLHAGEMETIRNEANARGLVYAFGRQFRFTPEMLAARASVAAGELGHVYFGKGQWLRLRGYPYWGWFTNRILSGGGAIIDLGVHALDALWFLAGCPRPLSVSAFTGTYFAPSESVDVEDTGFALLRFENDFTVSLEVAWAMNMSDAGAQAVDWTGLETTNTTLHGTRCALQLTPPLRFDVDPSDEKRHRKTSLPIDTNDRFASLPFPVDAFARQMTDFVEAVRTGRPPVCNADQAVTLMRMLDGIYASSAGGHEVRFD